MKPGRPHGEWDDDIAMFSLILGLAEAASEEDREPMRFSAVPALPEFWFDETGDVAPTQRLDSIAVEVEMLMALATPDPFLERAETVTEMFMRATPSYGQRVVARLRRRDREGVRES